MFDSIEKLEDVCLKDFCTFKIGGIGKIIVFPKNVLELKSVLKECKNNNLKYFILGNGSNILFPDYYFDKVIISLKNFNVVKVIRQNVVYAESGVNLFALNKFLADNSLAGLEFSFGIPASVGGFVYMNGGAFGQEISNFVLRVKIFENGKVKWLSRKDIDFQYRHSGISGIILGVELKLQSGDKKNIIKKQQENLAIRKENQPYNKFSAGSIFKRENGCIPAKIIDTMGLKGVKIGEAEISKKHAGFIVNNGDAKAIDVIALIQFIKHKTHMNFELEIVVLA